MQCSAELRALDLSCVTSPGDFLPVPAWEVPLGLKMHSLGGFGAWGSPEHLWQLWGLDLVLLLFIKRGRLPLLQLGEDPGAIQKPKAAGESGMGLSSWVCPAPAAEPPQLRGCH